MANLRSLTGEGGNAQDTGDQTDPSGGFGGFRARLPIPSVHPDLMGAGGFDPNAPGIHDFPGAAANVTIAPPPNPVASTKAQSVEGPRERADLAVTSTPRMPSTPTPQAGAASPAMDASSGVIPFTPLASSDAMTQVTPQGPAPVSGVGLRSPALFGSLGGLTGGGLGIPQDPTTRANNTSIEGLLQLLQRLQQG